MKMVSSSGVVREATEENPPVKCVTWSTSLSRLSRSITPRRREISSLSAFRSSGYACLATGGTLIHGSPILRVIITPPAVPFFNALFSVFSAAACRLLRSAMNSAGSRGLDRAGLSQARPGKSARPDPVPHLPDTGWPGQRRAAGVPAGAAGPSAVRRMAAVRVTVLARRRRAGLAGGQGRLVRRDRLGGPGCVPAGGSQGVPYGQGPGVAGAQQLLLGGQGLFEQRDRLGDPACVPVGHSQADPPGRGAGVAGVQQLAAAGRCGVAPGCPRGVRQDRDLVGNGIAG